MAGGLLNLVSVGADNEILNSSNPGYVPISFFKTTYKKYTNFGKQKFRVDYNGSRVLQLTAPTTYTFKIPRNAELLLDSYLVMTLPDIYSPIFHPCEDTGYQWSPYEFKWIQYLGCQVIQDITITCGSATLAKYTGDYLLNVVLRDYDTDKRNMFHSMTGNTLEYTNPANGNGRVNSYPSTYYTTSNLGAEPSIRGKTLYIPIMAWFSMNNYCAFPLVATQYNELNINITLRPIQDLFQVRDVFDPTNSFPYIRPDFNQHQFQMYRFLQTPPSENLMPESYSNYISNWNADIHLLCTYAFLSQEEASLFVKENQVYLVKDVYQYSFPNTTGTKRVKLQSTNGLVAGWMMYLKRSDVSTRNEWSNYTNWPYSGSVPYDIGFAPDTTHDATINTGIGPLYNIVNGIKQMTGIFTTGDFRIENQKDILQTMGILLSGDYRENTQTRGVYDYIEKFASSKGSNNDGLYCYNYELLTDPFSMQPSGAINMSNFKSVELEITTSIPPFDASGVNMNVVYDNVSGQLLGVQQSNMWNLYQYYYDLYVIEERYNVMYFSNGGCGLMFAR